MIMSAIVWLDGAGRIVRTRRRMVFFSCVEMCVVKFVLEMCVLKLLHETCALKLRLECVC